MERKSDKIIITTWNCRSIYNKSSEFKVYLNKEKPHIVCLQETWITDGYLPTFPGYNSFFKNRRGGRGGGLATLIRNDLLVLESLEPHLPTDSKLEALEIKLKYHRKILQIINIYNPNLPISEAEWDGVLSNLGPEAIVVGDFNSHHPRWTNRRGPSPAGTNLVNSMDKFNLNLITPRNLVTFLNSSCNYAPSTLDLFFVTNNIAGKIKIVGSEDPGSDHLMIVACIDASLSSHVRKIRPRWKLENADWSRYREMMGNLTGPTAESVEENTSMISQEINIAANRCFGKSKGIIVSKFSAPWWNEACEVAVEARKTARSLMRRYPGPQTIQAYRTSDAEARKIMTDSKLNSKKEYISSINSKTTTGEAWQKINAFVNRKPNGGYHLKINNTVVYEDLDKANNFAHFFGNQINSITENRGVDMMNGDEAEESHGNEILEGTSNQDEIEQYNKSITIEELKKIIHNLKLNSPGYDDIHNSFIKNLPEKYLPKLLGLYNKIFLNGHIPKDWKTALIVPILKNGKPKDEIKSYRPISLLPCLAKVLEKTVKERLYWLAEKQRMLGKNQSGFRSRLSIMDQAARLEGTVREGLARGRAIVVVFLDLRAAYDCIPHSAMIEFLRTKGIKGSLLWYLSSFLRNRRARVCVGASFSNLYDVKVGLPQGSALSPLLFSIYLSDVPEPVGEITLTEYADDIAVAAVARDEVEAAEILQDYLATLFQYLNRKSLVVNTEKTKAMIFSRKRNITYTPIKWHNESIEYVNQFKYLGLTLDSPLLSWHPHIEKVTTEGNKRANILKALCARDWGADRKMLVMVYRALVLSKLNYGAELYAVASKTRLDPLDKIQNNCLRMILGAERSSPIMSLELESNFPPLDIQRMNLQLLYFNRLRQIPGHLSMTSLLHTPTHARWTAQHPKPLVLRCRDILDKYKINNLEISPFPLYAPRPPWVSTPEIFWSMKELPQSIINQCAPPLFRELLQENYANATVIYTDGSKVSTEADIYKVSAAMVVPSRGYIDSWKLPGFFSIFSAELYGILRALKYVEGHPGTEYLIATDSLSALKALSSENYRENILIWEILENMYLLSSAGTEIKIEWVPGHSGIEGNEMADKAAVSATNLPYITKPASPKQDLKLLIKSKSCIFWKQVRDHNFMHSNTGSFITGIKVSPSHWPWSLIPSNRKVETALARLRIGHCGLRANRSRFGDVISPWCECGEPETISHVFMECTKYQGRRLVLRRGMDDIKATWSLRSLLGGSDAPKKTQYKIMELTTGYLRDTGLINLI